MVRYWGWRIARRRRWGAVIAIAIAIGIAIENTDRDGRSIAIAIPIAIAIVNTGMESGWSQSSRNQSIVAGMPFASGVSTATLSSSKRRSEEMQDRRCSPAIAGPWSGAES